MAKIIKLQFVLQLLFVFFFILTFPCTSLAASNSLEMHFIDVGQGDCAFVQLPSGSNILIDTGSPASAPAVVKYLRSLKIEKIDHLILTHPHDDHMGGIFSITDDLKIGRFYDNGLSNFDSTLYGDYLKIVRDDMDRYEILQANESLFIDKVTLDVMSPLLPPTGNLNNDSIVIKLTYGNIKILFSGDLGILGERRLLNIDADLKSQILKIGHHGENDSTSAQFLQKVNPEIAVISVSRINKYARPHQQVLKRLKDAGVKTYRSDVHGNIVFITDGNSFSVQTEK
jgi:competence protein ComEC